MGQYRDVPEEKNLSFLIQMLQEFGISDATVRVAGKGEIYSIETRAYIDFEDGKFHKVVTIRGED